MNMEMSTYPGPTTFHSEAHIPHLTYLSSSKRTSAPTPISEVQQANVIFQKMCANIALEYYNNKNDTRFELVEDEALDSYSFKDWAGSWIHCSFNAKEDSSTHNFFAELQYLLPTGPAATKCNILIQGETQIGCGNCKSVTHPIVGYLRYPFGNENHDAFAMTHEDTPGYPKPPAYHLSANFNEVVWAREQRIRGEKLANRALNHYNKTNGTKFAFVNDESTDWSCFSDTWIHISFNASDSSAVKLFFAEIKYDKFSEPAVTICKILEGETKEGCEHCHLYAVTHPTVGYRGDFSLEKKIDKKDKESCYKIYLEEFLGQTYNGPDVTLHS